MTKCEWGRCTAAARFTIRRRGGVPCMSKQTWRPRWCHRHVLSVLKRTGSAARYRKRLQRVLTAKDQIERGLVQRTFTPGRPLTDKAVCVECGARVPTSKLRCALSRKSVRKCQRHERTHGYDFVKGGIADCPAYCRACAPWLAPDDGQRNHGYLVGD